VSSSQFRSRARARGRMPAPGPEPVAFANPVQGRTLRSQAPCCLRSRGADTVTGSRSGATISREQRTLSTAGTNRWIVLIEIAAPPTVGPH
jgi:hypothetical protein